MIPSEEKVRAIVHRIGKALEKDAEIKVLNPDAMRKEVKKGVQEGVDLLEAVHAIALKKIQSLARNVEPGTREWDELFAKYVGEEKQRRGYM